MKGFFRFVYSCIFLVVGLTLLSDYFDEDLNKQAEEKIQALEKLVKSPETTTAFLDSVYTERTIKIAGVRTTFYETKYFFSANGKQYEGLYKPKDRPSQREITVNYLQDNPTINSVNPADELKILKENKGSNTKLYVSLGLLLIGGIGIWSYVSRILKNRKVRREEKERILNNERDRVDSLLNKK